MAGFSTMTASLFSVINLLVHYLKTMQHVDKKEGRVKNNSSMRKISILAWIVDYKTYYHYFNK
jgi:hypothetical protein